MKTLETWQRIMDDEARGDAEDLGEVAVELFVELGEREAECKRLRAELHRVTRHCQAG